MVMSPLVSPEDDGGLGEVCGRLWCVLLQNRAGLTVKELRAVLMADHGIDLEELRKSLGFGTITRFLAQLPCCRLRHPEHHGNCVVTYAPDPGCSEPHPAHWGSMEECWYEDTLPESFLSTSSPAQLHTGSAETPGPAPPQTSVSPQVQQHQAPATTGTNRTSTHLASAPPAVRHTGLQDGPAGVSPGRSPPAPTSSTLPTPSGSPAVPPKEPAAQPGPPHRTRPPGLDEEILRVVTQPGFASGLRVQKLTEILSWERGIYLDELSQGMGYQDVLDLLQQVPNVRLMDPTKGDQCVIKFKPGSRRNVGQWLPSQMASGAVTFQDQHLKTESGGFPYSSTSHEFLYPVTRPSSQKQTQGFSQNRVYHAPKHLPTTGLPCSSQKKRQGALVTIYTSKHHQKPGPPQQQKKLGAAMVFHASKPPAYVGPLRASPKTPAYHKGPNSASQVKTPGPQAYPMSPYPSQKNPMANPQGIQTAVPHPNHTPPVSSQDKAMIPPPASPQTQGPDKTLDPILKDEILVVLLQQPAGVGFGEFAGLFHRTHGYQFKLSRHGFPSLRGLLDEMKDLLTISDDQLEPLITCRGRHRFVFIGGGPFSSRV